MKRNFTQFVRSTTLTYLILLMAHFSNGQTIQVLSYNVMSPGWENHAKGVIEVISAISPDVMGLQESTGNIQEEIAAGLGSDFELISHPNMDRNENAIIFRSDRLKLIDNGVEEVPLAGNFTRATYVTWALFEEQSENIQFFFYVSHFPFIGDPDLVDNLAVHYNNANTLVQTIKEHLHTFSLPYITVGDYNATPNSTTLDFLLNQKDIVTSTATYSNPVKLLNSWELVFPGVEQPGTVGSGSSVFDYILVSPDLGVTNTYVDNSKGGGAEPPSDHFGVVATIVLGEGTDTGGDDDVEDPDIITSVNEALVNSGEPAIGLYPNPNTGSFSVKIGRSGEKITKLEIGNLKGKVVYQKLSFSNIEDIINEEINLPELAKGVYYLKVVFEVQLKTICFVVN
ncbi:endonuclease/exonuclease/phosphatase family protein [Xanthovirga aplysinae]|uniref:endonuclease/exonuclease/phosphatase family protein n=1 Tax=Xanthovirga aplysinae TaxID=2529853 RepID=UPI0012BD1C12|nr:endonuclease/exonuclease/phosphatase family protein [Xanthovirga aplysinae]MTI30319.1 T9SS type A sorting domain-containing protein [Xanthovirga aplysinae]